MQSEEAINLRQQSEEAVQSENTDPEDRIPFALSIGRTLVAVSSASLISQLSPLYLTPGFYY